MSRFFIRRPIVAIVIAIITVLGGLVALDGLPIAQFPQIVPPQILITAQYAGADALTIEQSVATPLEQQMNGVDDMLYMQSTNANDGTMTLTVTFDVDTQPNLDQVNVTNRMTQAQPNLPPEVNQFGLTMRKQTGLPMLIVSLYSPKHTYDALFLANYANINILDALYRVPGVGEARIFGAGDYAMRIWVKPDLLARLGLDGSRSHPRHPAAEHGQSRPVRSAPTLRPPGQEMTYTVRSQGRLQTEEEFGGIAVRSNPDGSVIHLRDVARIELGALNYQQIGRVNGEPGCAIAIFQAPGSNALEVAEGIRQQMNLLRGRFPSDLAVRLHARHDPRRLGGHPRDRHHAHRSDGPGDSRRLPVPPELAGDADPGSRRAGLADRHLHGLPGARLLAEHALALRPGSRHRPGRRRRDRRRRGGRASHRGRDGAARGDAEGDGRSLGPGRQHRADPGAGVHSGRVHGRHPGQPEQAVRDHDRHLGADLGVQRADAVAGARRDVAAAAQGRAAARRLLPRVQPGVRSRVERLRPRQPRADPQGRASASPSWSAFFVLAGGLGRRLPTSFVPEEDYGYFLLNVQLPPAASLQRTDDVCRKVEAILVEDRRASAPTTRSSASAC